jgi:hypothetical protein
MKALLLLPRCRRRLLLLLLMFELVLLALLETHVYSNIYYLRWGSR